MVIPERLADRDQHDGRASGPRPCLRHNDYASTRLQANGNCVAFKPTESLGKNRERRYTAKRFKTVIYA
ncbi:hypothetical protein RA263_14400 [Pseudomonas syringae pv. tagetis]|uniref:Uncharacterized protein n=1 Tax=Pseudomonas syringae pv. tagetis TaxID=129140 RepID=A0ABW7NUX9_9PSED|nr:hypothetical protein [Pseudomonas syringae group genomosp. 7]UNB63599.1 hypothetical protein MME54_01925 [Pseudomonas syringae pv. helianthi]UNB69063.1 hypothetical protein MME58_01940 [Pseudomonas syringae pv. tagetis]